MREKFYRPIASQNMRKGDECPLDDEPTYHAGCSVRKTKQIVISLMTEF
jgi:hypothetical protein